MPLNRENGVSNPMQSDLDANNNDISNVKQFDTDAAHINSKEVFIQSTAPSTPATDDIWIDLP